MNELTSPAVASKFLWGLFVPSPSKGEVRYEECGRFGDRWHENAST